MSRQIHWLRQRHELASSLDELVMSEAAGNCLAPAIPDGAQLFIDTKLSPRHGDYVSLELPNPIPGTDLTHSCKQYQLVTEPDGSVVQLIANSLGRFRLIEEKVEGVVVAFAVTSGRKSEQGAAVDAANAECARRIAEMQTTEAR